VRQFLRDRQSCSTGSKRLHSPAGCLRGKFFKTRNTHISSRSLSLCSSRYWAAKAPPFKVELRLNPSQSKAAMDTGSSRNATTPFCKVAKFQRNNVSTKKTQRPIYSQNHWQSVHKSRPREDGRGCVVRSVILTVSGGRQWSEHQMRRTKG
jgi:hypothetical protein